VTSPLCASSLAPAVRRWLRSAGDVIGSWGALTSCRLALAVALGSLALAPALPAAALGASQLKFQESGNPIFDQGSSYHYRTYVTRVVPSVPGLILHVLEFADRLIMVNHTGKTVTVYGYQEEPYARMLANGTVEVNLHSPAYYLNQNFYGDVAVPASASPSATPQWTVIDRAGQFEWHDHRIHWMSPLLPPEVTNQAKRTKIFEWKVPIRVGAQPATIEGQLFWVPEEGTKTPVAAIVALVVILLGGVALVLVVRRRRRLAAPSAPPGEAGGEDW
jgi:hypothetical protein